MASLIDDKMRKTDRILVLSPIEGVSTKDGTGNVDNRLFSGGNNLHAKQDPETMFWYVQYESGLPPEPLKVRFTKFSALLDYVKTYYKKRNVEIKEVRD